MGGVSWGQCLLRIRLHSSGPPQPKTSRTVSTTSASTAAFDLELTSAALPVPASRRETAVVKSAPAPTAEFEHSRETFERIVRDYQDDLYRFAFSLAKSPADASDLVQETFLRFARKGGQIRDLTKVKSWLFTTLYRQYLAAYRRRTKFPQVELDEVRQDRLASPTQAARNTESQLVLEAMQELDEKYRAPLSLFFIEDMSYKDISKVLRLPMGTVMSRLHRAKNLLRKNLEVRLDTVEP